MVLSSTFERGVSPFFLWIHRALCARLRRPCVGAPRGAGRGDPSEARQTFKKLPPGGGGAKKGPPEAGRAPRRRSGATGPRRRRGASRGDPPPPRPGDGRRRRRRSGAGTAPRPRRSAHTTECPDPPIRGRGAAGPRPPPDRSRKAAKGAGEACADRATADAIAKAGAPRTARRNPPSTQARGVRRDQPRLHGRSPA